MSRQALHIFMHTCAFVTVMSTVRLLEDERNTWTELRADPEMTPGPCIIDILYITKVCGCWLCDHVVPKIADTQPHLMVLSP